MEFQSSCFKSFSPQSVDSTLTHFFVRLQHGAAEVYEACGQFDAAAECYKKCIASMKAKDSLLTRGNSLLTCISSKYVVVC